MARLTPLARTRPWADTGVRAPDTLDHLDLVATGASEATLASQLLGVPAWLRTYCPDVPVPTMTLFRPPFGSLNNALAKFANSIGYTVAT